MSRFLPIDGPASLNRADPLSRGLVFATLLNDRGYTSGLVSPGRDYVTGGQATWQATPASNALVVRDAGRGLNSRLVTNGWLQYPTPAPRYDCTADFTIFLVACPTSLNATSSLRLLRKRSNSGSYGYLITHATSGAWTAQFSNNAPTIVTATSTTIGSTSRTDTICAVYKSASSLKLYVNGVLEATTSTSVVCAGSVDPLLIFGTRTTPTTAWDGQIFTVSMWNRALPQQAASRLHADPYLLWRKSPPWSTGLGNGVVPNFWPLM